MSPEIKLFGSAYQIWLQVAGAVFVYTGQEGEKNVTRFGVEKLGKKGKDQVAELTKSIDIVSTPEDPSFRVEIIPDSDDVYIDGKKANLIPLNISSKEKTEVEALSDLTDS